MQKLLLAALLALCLTPADAAYEFPPPGVHTAIVHTDARGFWSIDWPKNALDAKEPPYVQATAIVPEARDRIVICQVGVATAMRAEGRCFETVSGDGRVATPPLPAEGVEVRVLGVALPAAR